MFLKTGVGYIKDSDGKVISKYDLPPGEHPLKDGYTFVEVEKKEDLEKINVFEPPLSADMIREKKIQDEMRAMAIERLKARGEI